MQDIKLFIAGASGLIGSNCLKYFGEKGVTTKGSYYSYPTQDTAFYDTLNPDNPENFDLAQFQPTQILHAGALTHVDYCEQHPEESYDKTVRSTENLLAVAKQLGAAFIYISTDYVFDGLDGPYSEDDPVSPLSIYGKHKLQAEELVKKSGLSYLILRVTNVYGDEERNKNFVSRLIDMARKGEKSNLKLPYDQYATPVNAHDFAKALYLLINDNKTGIYHIASTDYLNRVQLAQKVLRRFEAHSVAIEAISTASLAQPASRPLQGGLKTEKFLKEYPMFYFASVDEYLSEKLKR